MSGRTEIAEVKRCARWLAYCLSIGWKKEQLDALEKLWWKVHPICLIPRQRRRAQHFRRKADVEYKILQTMIAEAKGADQAEQ